MHKVTFITNIIGNGGAERVVLTLADKLIDRGHEVSIISVYANNELKPAYPINPKIKLINITNGIFLEKHYNLEVIVKVVNTYKAMKSLDSDIYISFVLSPCVCALISNILLKRTLIVTERGAPDFTSWPKIYILLRDLLYGRASGVVFQTEAQREFYKRIPKKLSTIIFNPIVPAKIPQPYEGPRQKVIVTAGRLEPLKNFPLLLEAFAGFSKDFPDYILAIYGRGETKMQLIKYVRELKIEDKVIFKGFSLNIHEEIKGCAMFIMPSNSEGMPNALLEAMALGMPVISTDCYGGGPRQMINHGVNGLLVPVGDAKAMEKAMRELGGDSEYSANLGANAAKIRELHNIDRIIEQWEDYITSVIEKR